MNIDWISTKDKLPEKGDQCMLAIMSELGELNLALGCLIKESNGVQWWSVIDERLETALYDSGEEIEYVLENEEDFDDPMSDYYYDYPLVRKDGLHVVRREYEYKVVCWFSLDEAKTSAKDFIKN